VSSQNEKPSIEEIPYGGYDPRLASILHKLFYASGLVLIGGIYRSGKTNMALWTSQLLRAIEYSRGKQKYRIIESKEDVATNIETYGYYRKIEDCDTLRFWLMSNTHRKLMIIDEGNSMLSNWRSTSSLNVKFKTKIIPQLSHWYGRIILIAQDVISLDRQMYSETWCRGILLKSGWKNALCISKVMSDRTQITEIEPTTIKYDSHGTATFDESSNTIVMGNEERQRLYAWANSSDGSLKALVPPVKSHSAFYKDVRLFVKQVLEKEGEKHV
jgi:hypothetical protein